MQSELKRVREQNGHLGQQLATLQQCVGGNGSDGGSHRLAGEDPVEGAMAVDLLSMPPDLRVLLAPSDRSIDHRWRCAMAVVLRLWSERTIRVALPVTSLSAPAAREDEGTLSVSLLATPRLSEAQTSSTPGQSHIGALGRGTGSSSRGYGMTSRSQGTTLDAAAHAEGTHVRQRRVSTAVQTKSVTTATTGTQAVYGLPATRHAEAQTASVHVVLASDWAAVEQREKETRQTTARQTAALATLRTELASARDAGATATAAVKASAADHTRSMASKVCMSPPMSSSTHARQSLFHGQKRRMGESSACSIRG